MQGLGDRAGHLGEGASLAEEPGAVEVRGQVAIAQVEPYRLAEPPVLADALEATVDEAPAVPLVDHAGQGVADGAEIRRDVQAPDHRVVPGVDDDGQAARVEHASETTEQLGGSGAARERADLHAAV